MFHVVARSAGRAPLWSSWSEGRALWDRILRACSGARAVVLMPDHIHVLHPMDVRVALARALSGHTRAGGPPVAPLPPAEPLADPRKIRRSVRYLHLNPCRAGLCDDPLAWAFSTHRDSCGLAIAPRVRREADPTGFHRYVSSDPCVHVAGTELPSPPTGFVPLPRIVAAVSALTRTPLADLSRRGPARSLYLGAAMQISGCRPEAIAALVGASRTAASRTAPPPRQIVDLVRRVAGDGRFPSLQGPLPWVGSRGRAAERAEHGAPMHPRAHGPGGHPT